MTGIKIMKKRVSVLAIASAAAFSAGAADLLENIGNVKLKGYLGERLDAMIAGHVMGTDVDYITAAYQEKTETNGWWQTEFWGKYMHAAVPFAVYTGSEKLRANVAHSVARILVSQEPNGYIGNYPAALRCGEGWDVWGMKYTMMGLLHYYDFMKVTAGGDGEAKRVLEAAKRVCDYVIAEIGPNGRRGHELWKTGNWSGLASSSILEPVMCLYNRTGEQKYLDFAAYIVKGLTEPEAGPRLLDLALRGVSVADRNGYGNVAETHGGYVMKHNRWKAYEMMSCYQGLIEYAEIIGKKEDGKRAEAGKLLEAAIKTGADIVKEEITLAGGCASSEAWFHGARKQHLPYMRLQETCVTTTWMRFCGKLLEITDDPTWADQMERTFYNAYLGAMSADGREFGGYTPLTGCRYHGQHHCYMHTDCCTANGPRGFLSFLNAFFRDDGKRVTFNFYASALVKGFDMYSLYPRTDSARIVSHTEGRLDVRLRIPAWSATTEIKLNGEVQPGVKPGVYFTIARDWKLGDIVEIKFDMPVVAHTVADNEAVPGPFAEADATKTVNAHNVAFTRGPILLARDSRFNDGDMTEPFRPHSIGNGERMPTFSPVRTPSDDFWMAFSATLPLGSHDENPEGANPSTVFFCDYASAGNTWRRDNYYRTWFFQEWGPTE